MLLAYLVRFRAEHVVPARLSQLEEAFIKRDFATFGELTMRDSNQFHATCLDTYPPIFYLNATSRGIIRLVHAYNEARNAVVAAYTFDAGPNAVIFTTVDHMAPLLRSILHHYPLPALQEGDGIVGEEAKQLLAKTESKGPHLLAGMSLEGAVEKVYCVKVGSGARRLGHAEALMDLKTGLPWGMGPDS